MLNELLAVTVFSGAALASARWTWWRGAARGLPVLVYHKVGKPPEGSKLKDLWVSPEKFRSQVAWLLAHGYVPALFSDLSKAQKGGKPLPANAVLITFDDGYENNYTNAYKILRELGAKGNIFIVFDTIGKANLWHDPGTEPWINMASMKMLAEMQESGVMEFGSHTMSHPNLEKLPLEDAAWELTESKKQLENALGREISAFAYPYGAGAYTPAIRALALKAGYVLDFSFRQGKTPWPWNREAGPIDRLFIKGGDNNLDLRLQLTRGASRLW